MLTRRTVRELMDRHGLRPSRALGQNFVVDPNTVRRIAHLAGIGPGDRVVEVGAGLGSLTVALAATGASVVAVEVDRHLVPALRSVVEPVGVTVVEGDALTLDWAAVLGRTPGSRSGDGGPHPVDAPADAGSAPRAAEDSWAMVGNLPYNVATRLVLHLLEHVPRIERMLVMVQREVGERLAAGVGDRAYGIPSVKVAYWAGARLVARVPATVFLPQPRVESVLVELVRHAAPPVHSDRRRLFTLVEAGFGQRRKMLRRSLGRLLDEETFATAGISPSARAEELSLEQWARLADVGE